MGTGEKKVLLGMFWPYVDRFQNVRVICSSYLMLICSAVDPVSSCYKKLSFHTNTAIFIYSTFIFGRLQSCR